MPVYIEAGTGYGFAINNDDLTSEIMVDVFTKSRMFTMSPEIVRLKEDVGYDDIIDSHRKDLTRLGITISFIGDFYEGTGRALAFTLSSTMSIQRHYGFMPLDISLGDESHSIENLLRLYELFQEQGVDTPEPSWVSWITRS